MGVTTNLLLSAQAWFTEQDEEELKQPAEKKRETQTRKKVLYKSSLVVNLYSLLLAPHPTFSLSLFEFVYTTTF